MEERLGTSLDDVFEAETPASAPEPQLAAPSAGDAWKSTRGHTSLYEDGDRLEAFAAAELTLTEHLRAQLATASRGRRTV